MRPIFHWFAKCNVCLFFSISVFSVVRLDFPLMPCSCGNMSDLDHSLQKRFFWCSFAHKTVLLNVTAKTERPVELENTVTPTWSIPVSPSCTFTSRSSEVSRPEAWLKLEESKWLTTLQTTRRGTRSLRSTTKGTLAARRCSSVSWWSSAVARRSIRLQNATETCKGSAVGSRPHLLRVRSSQDLHLHMHDHLMQLSYMQKALVHVAKSLRYSQFFIWTELYNSCFDSFTV